MKSAYRLIGSIWDHLPEANIDMNPIPYDPSYSPSEQPFCLFDCDGKRRAIALTTLLAIDNRRDIETLRERFTDCSRIAVLVDYAPASTGCVHRKFYQHRVRQVMHVLRRIAPDAEIVLMRPPVLRMTA